MERELKENELIVSPTGKFSYQITPLTDIQIIVTREDLRAIKNKTKCFDLENNFIVDYHDTDDLINKKIHELRTKRYIECFPIVNRGKLWYDNLTQEQLGELDKWYNDWLNVTETLEEPVKPSWIK